MPEKSLSRVSIPLFSISLWAFFGEVSEWLKEHAWKVCILERVSRVRIPPSPPSTKPRLGKKRVSMLVEGADRHASAHFGQTLRQHSFYIGQTRDLESRLARHNGICEINITIQMSSALFKHHPSPPPTAY
jgi:hypothetical protein